MPLSGNNPLNLVYEPAIKWQGLADPPSAGRFCVFVSPLYGIRAGALNLIAQQDKHNHRTIADIVTAWAPPSENDTLTYINDVCDRTGFTSAQTLDLHTYEHLRPLLTAMIFHETGKQPFDAATLDEGLKMAGVVRPLPSVVKDPKVIAGTVVGVATAAQQVVSNTKDIWQSLDAMGIGATNVMIILGAAAAAAAIWFLLDRLKARRIAA